MDDAPQQEPSKKGMIKPLTPVANPRQANSLVCIQSQPKRVKIEGSENAVNGEAPEIPLDYQVNEMDKKIGLLVVGEFIHKHILEPFKEAYGWQRGYSWEYVKKKEFPVLIALSKINAHRIVQISPELLIDAINLFQCRTDNVAHDEKLILSKGTVAAYWRLVADKLWFADRKLIQDLLLRKELTSERALNSKYDPFENNGFMLYGGAGLNEAKVAIAIVELYELLNQEAIFQDLTFAEKNAIIHGMRRLRNSMAHPDCPNKMIKAYARVLSGCTGHVDACNYVLSRV
jgi:hypothetical protein